MVEILGEKRCEFCFTKITDANNICDKCGPNPEGDVYRSALSLGTVLNNRYIVGRVLGQGGFGISYLCFDTRDSKKVAIKEYYPSSISERTVGESSVSVNSEHTESFETGKKKFYDEAAMIAKFNGHPGIVNVYELFYENDTVYYVMEFLDGIDLRHYIADKGGKLSEEESLKIMMEICDALTIIHSVGVLHRDIAPDNIFMCRDGKIKLIDFGAARLIVGAETKSLTVILKPGFAPFEQYKEKGNFGAWTDIYALGATYYYCLTGKKIPAAPDRYDDEQLDLSSVSPYTATVLFNMVRFKIDDRYKSAVELKSVLMQLSAELNKAAEQIPPVTISDGTDTKAKNENAGTSAEKEKKESDSRDITATKTNQKEKKKVREEKKKTTDALPREKKSSAAIWLWCIASAFGIFSLLFESSECINTGSPEEGFVGFTAFFMLIILMIPNIIYNSAVSKRMAIPTKSANAAFTVLTTLSFLLGICSAFVPFSDNTGRNTVLLITTAVVLAGIITVGVISFRKYGMAKSSQDASAFEEENKILEKTGLITSVITIARSVAVLLVVLTINA